MLEQYYAILNNSKKCKYILNKHKLEKKIERAKEIFTECHFCENRCMIDRRKNAGKCKVTDARIASHFFHYGEEYMLIPSYTIFFSGCTFQCIYCQNWDISQYITGIHIPPSHLSLYIKRAREKGARNVNWVGGEPTPNIPYILEVLNKCNVNIPQIWNSNMYCSLEAMELLNDVMDVYLTDFKYGNDKCARRLSKIENYWEVVTRNHLIAYKQGEMIVRHLVLPNHIECCSKPIMEWISDNIPDAVVNIMNQYYPTYMACDEIGRRVTSEEYEAVRRYAERIGINVI